METTTMYSINPKNGKVVVHRLPWSIDTNDRELRELHQERLQSYLSKGYTLEPPIMDEVAECPTETSTGVTCPQCGKVCKSEFGLKSHIRGHKNEG